MRIIALPLIALFALAGSAHAQSVAQAQAQQVIALADQIRAAHPSHDYADLAPPKVVGATQWGAITALPAVAGSQQFDLNTNNIPAADCAEFITTLAPHFETILVGGSGPRDIGTKVVSQGHIDHTQLRFWCGGKHAPSVGLDAIGR